MKVATCLKSLLHVLLLLALLLLLSCICDFSCCLKLYTAVGFTVAALAAVAAAGLGVPVPFAVGVSCCLAVN